MPGDGPSAAGKQSDVGCMHNACAPHALLICGVVSLLTITEDMQGQATEHKASRFKGLSIP